MIYKVSAKFFIFEELSIEFIKKNVEFYHIDEKQLKSK